MTRVQNFKINVMVFHPHSINELQTLPDLQTNGVIAPSEAVYSNLPSVQAVAQLHDVTNIDHNKSTAVHMGGMSDSCPDLTENVDKHNRKIKHIFQEMVQYESRLLESLRILKMINDEISDVESQIKEAEKLREIFDGIPELYSLHCYMAEELERIQHGTTIHFLPTAFISDPSGSRLNIYKDFICRYASNFHNLAVILSKDKDFAAFCKSCVEQSVYEEQRIQDVFGMYFGVHCSVTRFRLLISKMHQELPQSDFRFSETHNALKNLNNLLLNSEGEMIRQDRISLAQLAFNKIEGRRLKLEAIPPLLREGPCKKISRRSIHKPIMERHLFLFEGYLVLTESASALGRYQVKSETTLDNMTLSEISEDDEIGVPHCFRIKAVNLCVHVAFTSQEEKASWWKALQQAIDEAYKAKEGTADMESKDLSMTGSTAVVWIRDEEATMCAECCTEFTLFNRRHHCRACGQVFCRTCSDYEAPIAFLDNKLQRVCEADYHLIYRGLGSECPIAENEPEQSKPVQTGHLLWSQCYRYVWSPKPITRPTLCSPYIKHVKLNLSEATENINILTSPPKKVAATPTESADQNSPSISQPRASSIQLAKQRPSHLISQTALDQPVYMSRVFCVLNVDTLFSMFAARADARPRGKLPLIGTRLFYLDTPPPTPVKKKRSSSFSDIEKKALVEDDSQIFAYCHIPNGSGEPAATRSPTGNALYRNSRPPPLKILPHSGQDITKSPTSGSPKRTGNPNGGMVDSLRPLREKLVQAAVDMRGSPPPSRKVAPGIVKVVDVMKEKEKNTSSPSAPVVDVEEQVTSVSPLVLRILRNQLGFLLLPRTSDIIAYYFEAPSVEVRNRWINAIRHVCLDYINR